jgi:hypothetical protein
MEMIEIYSPLNDLLRTFINSTTGSNQAPLSFHHKNNPISWNFLNFERHMRILNLVLNRIRVNAGIRFDNNKEEIFQKYEDMQLDLESFVIFLRITMDDVASFTPHFYIKQAGKISSKSFSKQKKWFLKNTELDSEWSRYLELKTGWFDEIKNYRDDLVHRGLYGYVEYDWATGKISAVKKKDQKTIKIGDLLDYVADRFSRFFEFLSDYESHFSEILTINYPEIEITHYEVWMAHGDWLKTLSYFLKRGNCNIKLEYKGN